MKREMHLKKQIDLLLAVFAACFLLSIFSAGAQTSLTVTNFGAVRDAEGLMVSCVSNSSEYSIVSTNWAGTNYTPQVGDVIEVFGAGPWLTYSNWGVVVTQQDIICLITNITKGTNLWCPIPAGWTTNAYCVVGTNNAPAFQAAINNASSLVASGQDTNVTIQIPAGIYLMVSSNVLNANYAMSNISDTHPALSISRGGITLLGDTASDTILMGCGAGMEHLVWPGGTNLAWISPGYAPYVPMRDTLVECRGPVANNQYPLVFENLTLDGGLTNGAQSYNYWTLIQGNGAGWDTTHHAVADWDGFVSYQMNQMKEFTNCVFQHWRGEMCICWTGDITNALNDWESCQFLDGNATADNMYYGQKLNNCVFNGVGKVMEYYQNKGSTNASIMENCLITNISEVAGPGNVHVDCALTGAVTNWTMPSYTFINNQFYDNVGMEFFSLNAAENVSFISNSFTGTGPGINLTGIGQQPSDGTQVWYMTNIVLVGNTGVSLSGGFAVLSDIFITNNIKFKMALSAGFSTNIILSGNSGVNIGNGNYDTVCGPYLTNLCSSIASGSYPIDLPNNNWTISSPYTIDGGSYFPGSLHIISYGNGRLHELQAAGERFYLDDLHPGLNPPGAILEVYAQTWTGANVTNFYMSAVSPGNPLTITNCAPPVTFYWNGSQWQMAPLIQFTATPTNGMAALAVQFNSPALDSASNAVISWNWNFGDGTASTAHNPSHTYTNTGTFFPGLTVTNINGFSEPGAGPVIMVNPPRPALTIENNQLILAWPTNAIVYILQYTTNLTPPVVWTTISSTPAIVNGRNAITSSIPGKQMFFRLDP